MLLNLHPDLTYVEPQYHADVDNAYYEALGHMQTINDCFVAYTLGCETPKIEDVLVIVSQLFQEAIATIENYDAAYALDSIYPMATLTLAMLGDESQTPHWFSEYRRFQDEHKRITQ